MLPEGCSHWSFFSFQSFVAPCSSSSELEGSDPELVQQGGPSLSHWLSWSGSRDESTCGLDWSGSRES